MKSVKCILALIGAVVCGGVAVKEAYETGKGDGGQYACDVLEWGTTKAYGKEGSEKIWKDVTKELDKIKE